MNKIKPLDQAGLTGACAPNHASKLQNKPEFQSCILSELLNFASSVPDFRRNDKGNIRHKLRDIINLIIRERLTATSCRTV